MARKNGVHPGSQYVTKTAAGIVAGACLLVGFFIGLNISVLIGVGGGGQQPTISVSQVGELDPKPNFDFDALRRRAEADPGNVDGWIRLGNACFDADRPAPAVEAYERALAIDGENADVWTDLGVMYRRMGEAAKAVSSFDSALAVNPGHETAMFNKGIVLLHDLNNRSQAILVWEGLLARNPQARTPGGKPVADMLREVRAGG
jgi:hypothetical protein